MHSPFFLASSRIFMPRSALMGSPCNRHATGQLDLHLCTWSLPRLMKQRPGEGCSRSRLNGLLHAHLAVRRPHGSTVVQNRV